MGATALLAFIGNEPAKASDEAFIGAALVAQAIVDLGALVGRDQKPKSKRGQKAKE